MVDALYATSRALAAGDEQAAAQVLQAVPGLRDGRRITLARLASLPPLPRTRIATALTNAEMIRVDQDGKFSGAGGGDSGKD